MIVDDSQDADQRHETVLVLHLAQPGTVRDFRIEGEVAAQWQSLVEIEGNYQRLRVRSRRPPTP